MVFSDYCGGPITPCREEWFLRVFILGRIASHTFVFSRSDVQRRLSYTSRYPDLNGRR